MDSVLIAYISKHNTTKQYAKWISEEVKSIVIDLDKIDPLDLETYKVIVFGSWIFDDKIVVRDFIIKHWDILQNKHVILFANGLTDPKDPKMKRILKRSFDKHIRDQIHFYPIGGKLNLDELSWVERSILKFKDKFRSTNMIDERYVKPIVVKIYALNMLE